jgi:hypothetical protein
MPAFQNGKKLVAFHNGKRLKAYQNGKLILGGKKPIIFTAVIVGSNVINFTNDGGQTWT